MGQEKKRRSVSSTVECSDWQRVLAYIRNIRNDRCRSRTKVGSSETNHALPGKCDRISGGDDDIEKGAENTTCAPSHLSFPSATSTHLRRQRPQSAARSGRAHCGGGQSRSTRQPGCPSSTQRACAQTHPRAGSRTQSCSLAASPAPAIAWELKSKKCECVSVSVCAKL